MTKKRLTRKINKILTKTILKLSKRQRFVITTIVLTLAIMLTQSLPITKVFILAIIASLLTFIFSLWCYWEELGGVEYLTLTILPILYTVGISLFYFLLPLRLIIRGPVIILYAIGIYAILSLENIFNVAAIRTIALLRAAKSFNMIFSILALFLILNTYLSFHYIAFLNFAIILILVFIAYIPLFWAERLTNNLDKNIILISFTFALIAAEIGFFISFYPLKPTFASLYLISVFYTLLGLGQNKLRDLPLKRSLPEYIIINISALIMLFVTSAWKI